MLVFHVTTRENAEQIRLNGFIDPQEININGHECVPIEEGVYFADQPLQDGSLDSEANFYFQIDIPDEILDEFEAADEASEVVSYREWVIPADVVNKYFTDRTINNLE